MVTLSMQTRVYGAGRATIYICSFSFCIMCQIRAVAFYRDLGHVCVDCKTENCFILEFNEVVILRYLYCMDLSNCCIDTV